MWELDALSFLGGMLAGGVLTLVIVAVWCYPDEQDIREAKWDHDELLGVPLKPQEITELADHFNRRGPK